MVRAFNKTVGFCLVARVCLTSGILTTNVAPNSSRPLSLLSLAHSYLPAATGVFPKQRQHTGYIERKPDNGLEVVGYLGQYDLTREKTLAYSDGKPNDAGDREGRRLTNNQSGANRFSPGATTRFLTEINRDHGRASGTKIPRPTATTTTTTMATTTTTATSRPRFAERPNETSRRSSSTYKVVEDPEDNLRPSVYPGPYPERRPKEYHPLDLADDEEWDHAGRPYRGKIESAYQRESTQDITTAIKALDRFLSGVLNDDGYNTVQHPPTNPVLALLLSRYGRYVPGTRNPRYYSYMAVNNIHNNKPFGKYKLESDEEPRYGEH